MQSYQLAKARARRQIKTPARFAHAEVAFFAFNAAMNIEIQEPSSYKEAVNCLDKNKWLAAMDDEMENLKKNKTWVLVERPDNQRLVGFKWIFKRKDGVPGIEGTRYKARIVAKGFTQHEGIDYTEIYSPVVRHSSIRILLACVVQFDMFLGQLDVKLHSCMGT